MKTRMKKNYQIVVNEVGKSGSIIISHFGILRVLRRPGALVLRHFLEYEG